MTTQIAGRFRKPDVLRMFPSFMWKAELRPGIREPVNESVLRTLGEIGAPLTDLKLGESWQSDHGLHELRQLHEFVDCVDEAADHVLAYLKIGHAGHPAHIHPNNYLSGVYYVQTQPGADTINFFDPRSQTGIIRSFITALTAENTEQVVVKIEGGTLLMFPAWLQHSVDLNGSDRVRISLGFNIMFPGYAEAMARPSWVPGRRPAV